MQNQEISSFELTSYFIERIKTIDKNYHAVYMINPDALNKRKQTILQVDNIFKQYNIDVMYFINYTHLGPSCGFPTLTLPIGYQQNSIPEGIYLLAPYFKESHLIELGYQLECLINQTFDPLKNLFK